MKIKYYLDFTIKEFKQSLRKYYQYYQRAGKLNISILLI